MITENEVEKAAEYIRDNAPEYAKAKADRIYLEQYRKSLKAIKMMEAEIVSTQEKRSSFNQKIDTPNLVIMYKDYQFNIQKEMRSVRQDLAFYQSFIKNVEEYTTNVIGDIRAENAPVKPKVKLNILLAGMAGLMFFLFLAFVVEYLERARKT